MAYKKILIVYYSFFSLLNKIFASFPFIDKIFEKLNIKKKDKKEQGKVIKLEEMSAYLPKAYVAIEDERFYKRERN